MVLGAIGVCAVVLLVMWIAAKLFYDDEEHEDNDW